MGAIVQRIATRLHSLIFRLTGGRLGGRMQGADVLLLTTVGAKTGKKRTLPLLYIEDGMRLVVVASSGGSPHHPGWYHNLVARPRARVRLRGETMKVSAEEAGPGDRERLWPLLAAMYPAYADYQEKTERMIPLMLLREVEAAPAT